MIRLARSLRQRRQCVNMIRNCVTENSDFVSEAMLGLGADGRAWAPKTERIAVADSRSLRPAPASARGRFGNGG
jgi:hypothetical protein